LDDLEFYKRATDVSEMGKVGRSYDDDKKGKAS